MVLGEQIPRTLNLFNLLLPLVDVIFALLLEPRQALAFFLQLVLEIVCLLVSKHDQRAGSLNGTYHLLSKTPVLVFEVPCACAPLILHCHDGLRMRQEPLPLALNEMLRKERSQRHATRSEAFNVVRPLVLWR